MKENIVYYILRAAVTNKIRYYKIVNTNYKALL